MTQFTIIQFLYLIALLYAVKENNVWLVKHLAFVSVVFFIMNVVNYCNMYLLEMLMMMTFTNHCSLVLLGGFGYYISVYMHYICNHKITLSMRML